MENNLNTPETGKSRTVVKVVGAVLIGIAVILGGRKVLKSRQEDAPAALPASGTNS